ncbi:MAG: hypothetical protein NZ602_10650 [Thermoguttaceae bacterium]|nr:hypothetical protein [Thermoguttaceae bacterium]MDW8038950.1 hypothetical protein [Thermoguttaceae bacterium]
MAEENHFDDAWYEEILAVNPRLGLAELPRDRQTEHWPRLFFTGIIPEEAEQIARWFGQDWRLPTIQEWRMLWQTLSKYQFINKHITMLSSQLSSLEPLIHFLGQHRRPRTWRQFMLLEGGVLEWVVENPRAHQKRYAGLGQPAHEIKPNVWNPLKDLIQPINPKERLGFFGVRLIKSIS